MLQGSPYRSDNDYCVSHTSPVLDDYAGHGKPDGGDFRVTDGVAFGHCDSITDIQHRNAESGGDRDGDAASDSHANLHADGYSHTDHHVDGQPDPDRDVHSANRDLHSDSDADSDGNPNLHSDFDPHGDVNSYGDASADAAANRHGDACAADAAANRHGDASAADADVKSNPHSVRCDPGGNPLGKRPRLLLRGGIGGSLRLRDRDQKGIYDASDNHFEVYDLAADPHETVNRAAEAPGEIRLGQQRLAAWVQY